LPIFTFHYFYFVTFEFSIPKLNWHWRTY